MKVCGRCKVNKNISDFRKRSGVSHGLSAWCKSCFNEYDRERYRNLESERIRKRKNQSKVIKKSQDYIWDYLKNNPCIDCGESDPVVLEFDHIDPKNKTANVSELIKYSIYKIEKEINKCEVRCANCHRRKTAKQFNTWRQKY